MHKPKPWFIITCGPFATKKDLNSLLEEQLNLCTISIGELIHNETKIKAESKLGQEIYHILQSGETIPNHLIIQLLEKKISTLEKGFVMFNFPATEKQFGTVNQLFSKNGFQLTGLLNLKLQNILMNRLFLYQ